MYPAKINVPILIIFFIRPDNLAEVFAQVKEARPSKLYLFQDGERDNQPEDKAKIIKCREIIKDIDWDCEVHSLFSDFNYGVDHAVYAAIKWAFETEDRLIILEDDIVASQSFFKFADALLEQYKDDSSISVIGGMNHLGKYKKDRSDYLFAETAAIWGWATWKRFFEKWDPELNSITNETHLKAVKKKVGNRRYKRMIGRAKRIREEVLENPINASFEACQQIANFVGDYKAIVPTQNLITNIGVGSDTFHATDSLKKISKRMQRLFFMDRYELNFPLRPPQSKEIDHKFSKKVANMLLPNIFIRVLSKIEGKIRRLIFR